MRYWRRPLDMHKHHVPKGLVHVIDERCKGCGICVEFCPKDVLELSEQYNTKGYHPPRPVHPETCVNCGLCELLCPEFAIYVESLNGASSSKPAHEQDQVAAKAADDEMKPAGGKRPDAKRKRQEAPSHV